MNKTEIKFASGGSLAAKQFYLAPHSFTRVSHDLGPVTDEKKLNDVTLAFNDNLQKHNVNNHMKQDMQTETRPRRTFRDSYDCFVNLPSWKCPKAVSTSLPVKPARKFDIFSKMSKDNFLSLTSCL